MPACSFVDSVKRFRWAETRRRRLDVSCGIAPSIESYPQRGPRYSAQESLVYSIYTSRAEVRVVVVVVINPSGWRRRSTQYQHPFVIPSPLKRKTWLPNGLASLRKRLATEIDSRLPNFLRHPEMSGSLQNRYRRSRKPLNCTYRLERCGMAAHLVASLCYAFISIGGAVVLHFVLLVKDVAVNKIARPKLQVQENDL